MKLTILMPVYNEQDTVENVLNTVNNLPLKDKEIIIIDDGSTDRTKEILGRLKTNEGLKILHNPVNSGKGAAIELGLKHATGDVVCIQDSDLEYEPAEILKLLDEMKKTGADAVYGSRFLKKNQNIYKRYLLGNKFLTFMINIFYGAHYTDSYTCYKLIRKDVFNRLNLKCKRFEIESEISIKLIKLGYRVTEIPINYHPRTLKEGKKIGLGDAIKGVLTIIKLRF